MDVECLQALQTLIAQVLAFFVFVESIRSAFSTLRPSHSTCRCLPRRSTSIPRCELRCLFLLHKVQTSINLLNRKNRTPTTCHKIVNPNALTLRLQNLVNPGCENRHNIVLNCVARTRTRVLAALLLVCRVISVLQDEGSRLDDNQIGEHDSDHDADGRAASHDRGRRSVDPFEAPRDLGSVSSQCVNHISFSHLRICSVFKLRAFPA